MIEEHLPGGRRFGAVRLGDTVRRVAQPWTATVQALLRHLEAAGFAGAPRSLGFDDQGREVLTYLVGNVVGDRVPWPPWVFSDSAITQVGHWLRGLHDATTSFTPPSDAVWFARQTWRPGLICGHHDAAPYNAVWRGDDLVGFIDWETAGPSSRELDLAFAALTWVPMCSRKVAAHQGFTDFYDRPRRLSLLLDAYGYEGERERFPAAVAARAQLNADVCRRMAGSGGGAAAALLPLAADLEQAVEEIETMPAGFWTIA